MSKWQGKRLSVEITGESHAPKISAVLKGFPKITIDKDKLNAFLQRRKATNGVFSTSRIEDDVPIFTGLDNDTIKGDFTADILNKNVKSGDYNNLLGKPRPSHADYAWYVKDGTVDFSGGGRFSGRLTAMLCVAGGIIKQYLEDNGVFISAYVSSVGKVNALSYKQKILPYKECCALRDNGFPSLNKKQEILDEIEKAKKDCDSVGGTVECVVYGLKKGLGDNLFSGLEGKISSLCYAVPAVKGVEFGSGFALSTLNGSTANDELFYDNGEVKTYTNNAGGINGGISNGAPITLRVAFRPTPSIGKPQRTVDLINKTNTEIQISGRHDACIVPRAVPCIESAVALALADELLGEL